MKPTARWQRVQTDKPTDATGLDRIPYGNQQSYPKHSTATARCEGRMGASQSQRDARHTVSMGSRIVQLITISVQLERLGITRHYHYHICKGWAITKSIHCNQHWRLLNATDMIWYCWAHEAIYSPHNSAAFRRKMPVIRTVAIASAHLNPNDEDKYWTAFCSFWRHIYSPSKRLKTKCCNVPKYGVTKKRPHYIALQEFCRKMYSYINLNMHTKLDDIRV